MIIKAPRWLFRFKKFKYRKVDAYLVISSRRKQKSAAFSVLSANRGSTRAAKSHGFGFQTSSKSPSRVARNEAHNCRREFALFAHCMVRMWDGFQISRSLIGNKAIKLAWIIYALIYCVTMSIFHIGKLWHKFCSKYSLICVFYPNLNYCRCDS